MKRLHAEVLALEQDVMRLRTERATYLVVDYDARLQDLHTRLITSLKHLAHWEAGRDVIVLGIEGARWRLND